MYRLTKGWARRQRGRRARARGALAPGPVPPATAFGWWASGLSWAWPMVWIGFVEEWFMLFFIALLWAKVFIYSFYSFPSILAHFIYLFIYDLQSK